MQFIFREKEREVLASRSVYHGLYISFSVVYDKR
jgi:hypothetical protein